MVPHAGYLYSGSIAGETYARVDVPARAVVICPNHTGRGVRRSIWVSGVWHLPGGDVPVDAVLAEAIREAAGLEADVLAHQFEHAGEVQLPFLRARRSDVRVVPICLSHLNLAECREIGEGLAGAVRSACEDPRDALLVASTDLSHFIPAEDARRLDRMALDHVLAIDPEGLYETVTRQDISMCGFIPTTVVLFAARALGATHTELVRYGNSGETSGDTDRVVGYAGVVLD
jgi:hypothetical protein